MLLATTIALLILYGLYVAMDLMVFSAQVGREVVEEATLSRSVVTRMTNDLTPAIGVPDPGRYKASDGGTAASEETGGEAVPTDAPIGAIYHLVGTPNSLTIFVSRVPRELYRPPGEAGQAIYSDQRRISYFVNEKGLIRQEVPLVTQDALLGTDLAVSEASDLGTHNIAREVLEIQFRYWDGETWQDTWDGTSKPIDGMTPLGSPMAIEVTMLIELAARRPGEDPRQQVVRHVISVPSANGLPQQTSQSTTPMTGMSGMSGTTPMTGTTP